MSLAEKRCLPCEGGTPPIGAARAGELLAEIPGWTLSGERLRRAFRFRDFRAAMRFVNAVAELAEAEGHHPDIAIHDWNRVDLSTWTHAIGGLSENDFVLAAKIDRIPDDPANERG
jgi:4a-hydroxytetrahydrobiopterin dehydratase